MKVLQAARRFLAPALLALCGFAAGFSGCAGPLPPQSEFILGTICTVNLYRKGSAALYRRVFDRFRELEGRVSAHLAGSELDAINRMAGKEPVRVHGEVLELIDRALYYADISDGAFDPTVGPLVALWGIGSESPHIPAREELDGLLPLVNRRDVEIDRQDGTVFLRRQGMRLDLGAIAKGYAADEARRIIREAGVKRAIIDLGGNVFAYGEKENGEPWRIAVQNPLEERGAYIGIAEVRNKTVVTSGVYERYVEAGGRRYHHILSPRTGYPAETGLLSVTIIADSSLDADGLSTGAFVLGYEAGRALIESRPGTEAIFVLDDLSVRCTPGALEYFTLTNPVFTLE